MTFLQLKGILEHMEIEVLDEGSRATIGIWYLEVSHLCVMLPRLCHISMDVSFSSLIMLI